MRSPCIPPLLAYVWLALLRVKVAGFNQFRSFYTCQMDAVVELFLSSAKVTMGQLGLSNQMGAYYRWVGSFLSSIAWVETNYSLGCENQSITSHINKSWAQDMRPRGVGMKVQPYREDRLDRSIFPLSRFHRPVSFMLQHQSPGQVHVCTCSGGAGRLTFD